MLVSKSAPLSSMTTERFIEEFKAENPLVDQEGKVVPGVNSIGLTALKVLTAATIPVSLPLVAVVSGIAGGLEKAAAATSIATQEIFNFVAPPTAKMDRRSFYTGECPGGKLYYQGDIPILELEYDNPYQAGGAHGYLLGYNLDQLLNRMWLFNHSIGIPKGTDVPHAVAEIRGTLPAAYLEELEGIRDGFIRWSSENNIFSKEITVDDLILFHMMPDSLHFDPITAEEALKGDSVEGSDTPVRDSLVGCTVVIDSNSKKEITFGRNMDWPSHGIFGSYSLVINRKHKDKKRTTLEIGFPGFAGTLTGMNKDGLSLAMNVCPGTSLGINGLPAAFYNRLCLESSQTFKDVQKFVRENAPLGPYHLSVADSKSAGSFHFYQGPQRELVQRRGFEKKAAPLITTNCRYLTKTREVGEHYCSAERREMIQKFYREGKKKILPENLEIDKIVEATLTLPFVNNKLTTHVVVMKPGTKRVKVAFDNTYAGSIDLHEIDTTDLFS